MDLIDLKEDTDDAEVLDSYHPPSEHLYHSVPHLTSAESATHGYPHSTPAKLRCLPECSTTTNVIYKELLI